MKWQKWSEKDVNKFLVLIKELSNSDPVRTAAIKEELSALSGEDSDLSLSGWLKWFIENYLALPDPVSLLKSPNETSLINSGPSMRQGDVFDKSEYNWCALEKIKNSDDMQKLRSIHNDLEYMIDVDLDAPYCFSRLTGLSDGELDFFRGKTFSQVIFDEKTEVMHLRILKDYAKVMMIPSMPAKTQRSGAILYASAIAQAIVKHDLKISSLSYSDLSKSLEALLERPYLVDSFSRLFKEALNKCR